MHRFGLKLSLAFLLAPLTGSVLAAEKGWDFPAIRYALCEGIGAAGTYKVEASATFTTGDGVISITRMDVKVDSAAFAAGHHADFGAVLLEKDATGKVVGRTMMVLAWFDVIAAGGSSSITKYLPPATTPPNKHTGQRTVKVAKENTLFLSVSPMGNVGNAACPLGASENKLDF